MIANMDNLTSNQKNLVMEIMERENPQTKVDETVAETKMAINVAAIIDMMQMRRAR